MNAAKLFELELVRRGVRFSTDASSGRYLITAAGQSLAVDVSNLRRMLTGDAEDKDVVAGYVDAVLRAVAPHEVTSGDFYWCLERNDYVDSPSFAEVLSPQLDRVLTRFVDGGRLVAWATPSEVGVLDESGRDPLDRAWLNLDHALQRAGIRTRVIDGATLVFFETDFVSKASFMLAPTLRDIVSPLIGWPVLAVAPARDFQYFWNPDETALLNRVGPVIAREFLGSPHPLSTEVFRVGAGIEPIGAFRI